jgi:hypothetical protein
MFPLFPPRKPTPQDLQRQSAAKDAKELKEYLDSLTPEDRAKFWADIEGKGTDPGKQKPSGD